MSQTTKDEIKQALGGNSYSTNTGDTTTDYYNALKNESYKTLLNSEIQASVARDQALKYTNNSLRANGYGNQGLAESTNLGVQNQYRNALANASNNYMANMSQINQDQRQEHILNQEKLVAQQDNTLAGIKQNLSNAETTDALNKAIETYGYGIVNSDGSVDWNQEALNGLSEQGKKDLMSYYQLASASLNTKAEDKANAKLNDNFNVVATLMDSVDDIDTMNKILATFGYGEVDKDGNMDWTKLDNSSLDEDSKKQLKSLYEIYNSKLGSDSTLDQLNKLEYIKNNGEGDVSTLGEHFKEEMKYIVHNSKDGKYLNGDVVFITNGQGEKIYMQYSNGGFKMVDEDTYKTARNQYTLKRVDSKGFEYKKA